MAENELLDSKGRFLRRWQELCLSGVSAEEAAAIEVFGYTHAGAQARTKVAA